MTYWKCRDFALLIAELEGKQKLLMDIEYRKITADKIKLLLSSLESDWKLNFGETSDGYGNKLKPRYYL